MTVRRGAAWGTLGPAPDGLVLVRTDAELGAIVNAARSTGTPLPPCGLLGGDLMRTVGGTGDAGRFDGVVVAMPVDIVRVRVDDERTAWFASHLVARASWWRGPLVAAMNAEFLGDWDVAPRGHPDDGRVGLVEVSARFGVRQRWAARRRLPAGTHVPHPDIATREVAAATLDLSAPTPLQLDGVVWGRARRLELTVEPDVLTVVV